MIWSRSRGGFAIVPVRVREKVQCALNTQRFAIHVELQARDGFVKHAFPCVSDNTQIMQEFFQLI